MNDDARDLSSLFPPMLVQPSSTEPTAERITSEFYQVGDTDGLPIALCCDMANIAQRLEEI